MQLNSECKYVQSISVVFIYFILLVNNLFLFRISGFFEFFNKKANNKIKKNKNFFFSNFNISIFRLKTETFFVDLNFNAINYPFVFKHKQKENKIRLIDFDKIK